MAEQTVAPISRVDTDRLYVDSVPDSWRTLEERAVRLLESRQISVGQTRAIVASLRALEEQGVPVPQDAGDLYLLIRPIIEAMPGGYG